MSSFWSKPFRNIFGSDLSQDITAGTFDKWIKPEDKNTLEYAVSMLAGAAAAPWLAGELGISTKVAEGIIKAGVAMANDQSPISAVLGAMGGDVGKFFNSTIGKVLIAAISSGNGGNISGLLDKWGITGKAKDMLEEIATFAALSFFSKEYAKDAISKANEMETRESDLVKSLADTAAQYSNPVYQEGQIQKGLEDLATQYGRAKTSTEQNLYGRGMGERMPGATEALARGEAIDRFGARRTIGAQNIDTALKANAAAIAPVSTLAAKLRAKSDLMEQLPFDFYMSIKNANRADPAQMQGGGKGAAATGGTTLNDLIEKTLLGTPSSFGMSDGSTTTSNVGSLVGDTSSLGSSLGITTPSFTYSGGNTGGSLGSSYNLPDVNQFSLGRLGARKYQSR